MLEWQPWTLPDAANDNTAAQVTVEQLMAYLRGLGVQVRDDSRDH